MTRLRVPKNFNGRNPQMRRDLASALRDAHPRPDPAAAGRAPRGGDAPSTPATEREIEPAARRAARRTRATSAPTARTTPAGPSAGSSSTATRKTLKRRVEQRTNTVARQFDRVCEVLTALDYLDGDDGHRRAGGTCGGSTPTWTWSPPSALRHGLWDDLDALRARRGAVGAGLRGPPARRRRRSPRLPGGAGQATRSRDDGAAVGASCDALERDHKLDFLRQPDAGFAWAAYRWAEGDDLDDVLGAIDLAAGDFVRWMKQLLDLAGQVADAAGDTPLRATAREVVRRLRRGVVAYSGLAD